MRKSFCQVFLHIIFDCTEHLPPHLLVLPVPHGTLPELCLVLLLAKTFIDPDILGHDLHVGDLSLIMVSVGVGLGQAALC
jgi:hypothetical protein